jgi:hypothetical protein
MRKVVATASSGKDGHVLHVPSELIEEFRSAFTERLAANSFDLQYKTTPEGQMLEQLIDKFFQNDGTL